MAGRPSHDRSRVRIVVNDQECDAPTDASRSLLSFLREDCGLTAAKYACGEGACGACTVLVDGEPVRSCIVTTGEVAGRTVVTAEGISAPGMLHPVARAFLEGGAMQCGYCTPGMIVRATALLAHEPDPGEDAIRVAMDGNICRCCTYPRIVHAITSAAAAMRGGAGATPLPPEAPAELSHAPATSPRPWDLEPVDRRDYFDRLGPGLVVVLAPGRERKDRPAAPGPWSMNGGAWLHVGASGVVMAFTGKVDVGQRNRHALSRVVSEELRVLPKAVRMVMGDTDVTPYDIGTFGSRSTPDAGEDLRVTAAAAREALLGLAADRWDRNPDELVAEDGRVRELGGGLSVAYGDLVGGLRRVESASGGAVLTPADSWRAGTAADVPVTGFDAVTGARRFTTDLTRPGMLHGAILRPPQAGSRLRSADTRAARALDGVTIVREGPFIGAVAPTPAAARHALSRVRARWDVGAPLRETDLVAHLRANPVDTAGWEGPVHHEVGDPDGALARATTRLEATYTTSYIAHAPLETRAALAEWAGDRLTVWVGTQVPFGVRRTVADALGVDEALVRVVVPPTGGGFGGKHAADVAEEAARLARAVGRPVHVRWSRTEEFRFAYFRPMAVIDVRSGVDASGSLIAWELRNLNAGAQSILPPYTVANQRVVFQPAASPLRQGPYRALAATANTFARESHIDEIAGRIGADPLDYRLRHLDDDRLATVLRAAAERAGWASRSPAAGSGMGIACGVEKGGYVATCVELRVRPDGTPRVTRLVTAFECGAVVDHDGLRNQVEGATIMGLGGALFEAIHFQDGEILNPSFSSYRVPRFLDAPDVEVVLVDRRDVAAAGGGEAPIIAVAPALANAVFAATGERRRSLPLFPTPSRGRPAFPAPARSGKRE